MEESTLSIQVDNESVPRSAHVGAVDPVLTDDTAPLVVAMDGRLFTSGGRSTISPGIG